MKTYLAITALLCSLTSAVDISPVYHDGIYHDDDILEDDLIDDDELSDNSNSLSYNGFKYTLSDKRKFWNEAKDSCKSEGGNLLTIHSDDELAAILPLIPLNPEGRHRDIHIGLREVKDNW